MAFCTVMAMSNCKNSKGSKSKDKDKDDVELAENEDGDEDETPADDEGVKRSDYKFETQLIADEEGTMENIIVSMILPDGTVYKEEVEPVPLDTASWTGFGTINEEDINFDGYPDLQVCLGPFNAYGNFTYAAWLWDEEARRFVSVPKFDELFDPSYNSADKTIASSFRMDDHEDNAVYKWDGFKLKEVSSETIVYSELEDE